MHSYPVQESESSLEALAAPASIWLAAGKISAPSLALPVTTGMSLSFWDNIEQ